jgi:O-methyltransferase
MPAIDDPTPGEGEVRRLRAQYLDLLEKAILHLLYRPIDVAPWPVEMEAGMTQFLESDLGRSIVSSDPVDRRRKGLDFPEYALSLGGVARLANARRCVETVLEDDVPGDVIETGVWRGGISILMRGVLEAWGADRSMVVADSFEGLPAPDPSIAADRVFTDDDAGRFAVSEGEVRANFANFGFEDRVEFLRGWFSDSLPTLDDRTWSVIRMDGDLYESTMDALTNLYPRLSPGGFVIVDDWILPPCRAAVEEFRAQHQIEDPIEQVDFASTCWRRSGDDAFGRSPR